MPTLILTHRLLFFFDIFLIIFDYFFAILPLDIFFFFIFDYYLLRHYHFFHADAISFFLRCCCHYAFIFRCHFAFSSLIFAFHIFVFAFSSFFATLFRFFVFAAYDVIRSMPLRALRYAARYVLILPRDMRARYDKRYVKRDARARARCRVTRRCFFFAADFHRLIRARSAAMLDVICRARSIFFSFAACHYCLR